MEMGSMNPSPNKHYLSAGILFLIVLFSGLMTICPTIYWRDSAEFVDVVYTFGIPHPAGSPTYILLARILAFLPLGNIAFKVNLVSVICQALAITLLYTLSTRILTRYWPSLNPFRAKAGAFLASLSFGLSPSLWLVSSTAEVYSMSALFFLGLIFCAFQYWHRLDFRWLFFGSFLYGLAAGVHATVVFYLPAVFWLFFVGVPRGSRWRVFFITSGFFLWGFSTYLYLPIRSLANPTFDWGNPETLEQFLIHITDRKTKNAHFDVQLVSFFQLNITRYWGHLMRELGWVATFSSVMGLFLFLKKDIKFLGFLFILYLGNVIFYLNWKTGDGIIPSNLILSLGAGIAGAHVLEWIAKTSGKISSAVRWDRIFATSIFFFILFFRYIPTGDGISPYQYANKSNFYHAYDFARAEYQKMPQDSMVISTLFWFPFRFFQDIERYREDISIIMASDILAPQYFNPMTPSRFPKIKLPEAIPRRIKINEYFRLWYQRKVLKMKILPPNNIMPSWFEYMPELINLNILEKQIFYEPHILLIRPIYKNLIPDKFLFKISPGEQEKGLQPHIYKRYMDGIAQLMSRDARDDSFVMDINGKEYYMTFLLAVASYFILHDHNAEGNQLLQLSAKIRPHQGTVEYYLGQTYFSIGEIYAGLKKMKSLISREPYYSNPYTFLGRFYLANGDLKEAKKNIFKAKSLKVERFQFQIFLTEYYWRSGEYSEAQKALKNAENFVRFEDEKTSVELWNKLFEDMKDPYVQFH